MVQITRKYTAEMNIIRTKKTTLSGQLSMNEPRLVPPQLFKHLERTRVYFKIMEYN